VNRSISALFSASAAACRRIYSEAFSDSASAIFLMQSLADGRRFVEVQFTSVGVQIRWRHSGLAARLPGYFLIEVALGPAPNYQKFYRYQSA
jgi:hypothetical protein